MNILNCIKLALSTVGLSPQSLHSPLIQQTLGAACSFHCICVLLWAIVVFEKPELGTPGSSFLPCTKGAADAEADPPVPLVLPGDRSDLRQTPPGRPGPVPQHTPGSSSGCPNLPLKQGGQEWE